jgi:hypothetical protein
MLANTNLFLELSRIRFVDTYKSHVVAVFDDFP